MTTPEYFRHAARKESKFGAAEPLPSLQLETLLAREVTSSKNETYLLAAVHRCRRLDPCACPASVVTAGARRSVDKVKAILRDMGLREPFGLAG